MHDSELDRVLAGALADRRLLDHPFYRRWEAGKVSIAELGAYAAQYRHFERYLPVFLSELSSALPEGPARDLVKANLDDEQGDPVPHAELFEHFAAAVAAGADPTSPATAELIGTYDDLLSEGPTPALAGFLAYESQAAEIAQSKAEGLRRHYHLDDSALRFWDHHAQVDVRHHAWAREALATSACTRDAVETDLRRAAVAWWTFLDEREARQLTLSPISQTTLLETARESGQTSSSS
jgi:pyrroloquinoline-quinone synthase